VRALVVFYSLTGTTRRVAQALAAELGAEQEGPLPQVPPRVLRLLAGRARKLEEQDPGIGPPEHQPSGYGIVVVGGPV
jgi:hypothetical protein